MAQITGNTAGISSRLRLGSVIGSAAMLLKRACTAIRLRLSLLLYSLRIEQRFRRALPYESLGHHRYYKVDTVSSESGRASDARAICEAVHARDLPGDTW